MRAILLGSLLNCLCFIALFHLPWAQIYLPVSEGSWKMIVPVRIGLTKCFSDVCVFDSLVHDTEDPSSPIRIDSHVTKNFIFIHHIVLGFLVASCILCIFHSCLIICGCSAKFDYMTSSSRYQNSTLQFYARYIYPAAVCCNIFALFIYCGFTVWFLNGGGFLEGTMLLVLSIMIGIVCCMDLFLEAYHHSYHSLPWNSLIISSTLNNASIL